MRIFNEAFVGCFEGVVPSFANIDLASDTLEHKSVTEIESKYFSIHMRVLIVFKE